MALAAACLAIIPSALAQQAPSAQGRVPIEGLPAFIGDAMKALQREEPAPQSLFEARRQAERAAQLVSTLLESEGYYQADVQVLAEGETEFRRSVRVSPGTLFTYASRAIAYPNETPDNTTRGELDSLLSPLVPGAPARARPVIDTGEALIARLREAGYPDARLEPVDALADAATHSVELTFRLRPGLRASFGDLSVTGLVYTQPQFIDRLRPWRDGELLTPKELDEFRARLAATGLFSSAAVSLAEGAQTRGDGLTERNITVALQERERFTIAAGASASTSEGVGVDGVWEIRNLTGQGDRLRTTGQIASLQARLGLNYRMPDLGRYGRNLEIGGEVEDFSTDAFSQTGVNLSASVEDQLTPRVLGSVGAELGYARIFDNAALRSAGIGRDVMIISGFGRAEYVGVSDILDPSDGVRARLSLEPGITFGDTNIAFARISGEASIYARLGADTLVGALRGRLGAIVGPNGAPPDRLFFAGGGGSVRGYEYQSLSPRDAAGQLTGGRSLIELSGEVRWRADDRLGYVAFVDAGSAGSDIQPSVADMRLGAGIGIRYYTDFGPLRADIAVPLRRREGEAAVQFYISIGQAF
jgi:translocation and assembly module TamA